MANDNRDDQNELKRRRAAIDVLDRELLRVISDRAAHAQAIGALKHGPAYRPEREAEVLRRVVQANRGPLSNEAVAGVFREIMSACLALEEKLSVAYLGPAGTYSHGAWHGEEDAVVGILAAAPVGHHCDRPRRR